MFVVLAIQKAVQAAQPCGQPVGYRPNIGVIELRFCVRQIRGQQVSAQPRKALADSLGFGLQRLEIGMTKTGPGFHRATALGSTASTRGRVASDITRRTSATGITNLPFFGDPSFTLSTFPA